MSTKKGPNSAKKAQKPADHIARSQSTSGTSQHVAAGSPELENQPLTKVLEAVAILTAKLEALEGAFESTKAELITTKAEMPSTSEPPAPPPPQISKCQSLPPLQPSTSEPPPPPQISKCQSSPPLQPSTTECRHLLAGRKLLDLPEFNGSPQQWPQFYSAFQESSSVYQYTAVENLFRLQKCLKGAAKEVVESLLIHPSNIGQIIDTLEFSFGRPELLIRHQLKKVREVSPISENKLEQLIPFHIKVQNLVAFLSSTNSQQHMSNPILLEELVNKLPPSKQLEWAKTAYYLKPYATISDFNSWLSEIAKYVSIMSAGQLTSFRADNKTKGHVLHAQTPNQFSGTVRKCQNCGDDHFVSRCEKFLAATINNRWNIVKEKHLCFSCLKPGHASAQCRAKRPCNINACRKRHHQLLHETTTGNNRGQAEPSPVPNICLQNSADRRHLLYRIVPVIIYGPKGEKDTFAFLDEGSSVTMIEQCLADEIGASGDRDLLRLQWYGNKVTEEPSQRVTIKISGRKTGSPIYPMSNVRTVKDLCLPTQTLKIEELSSNYHHIKNLPIDEYENAKPKILIGLEHCHLGIGKRVVVANYQSAPIATSTKLGWVVYGPTENCQENKLPRVCLIQPYIHEIVSEYFSTEGFGTRPIKEEQEYEDTTRALQVMKSTTRRVADRFETGLIWKADNITLPDSYEMAYNRLVGVERKMAKDVDYAKQYNSIIASYIQKGYARELSKSEQSTVGARTWYLPHFLVTNVNKPGKYRLVFDAAATTNGTSLNDNLLKGPDQYSSLVEILIKFREGAIGVCGDIVEMFPQVRIRREDQDAQRFLWRYGESSIEPRVFVMSAMIFGASCSPASAQFVKNVNAEQHADSNSRAAEAIVNRHYVDDYVDSFHSEQEAIETSKSVREIHQNAGFVLKRFMSNSCHVLAELNNVAEDDTVNMDKASENATNKILGMHWDPKGDVFVFKINTYKIDPRIINEQRSVTKRELLRITMSIFDPYGLLANVLVYPKRLLQEVWEINLDWDDSLPPTMHVKFHHWLQSLNSLVHLQVPRCYSLKIPRSDDIQLHIFVDASEEAFGAVAYLRIKDIEVDVAFVCGKSRCAPLKRLSVPRLELQAAVLGTRLKISLQRSLSITITNIVLWSDSQTVLHWLRSGTRKYKPFVAHRIGEILDSTSTSEWRWVPTKMNAADASTRTVYPIQFNPSSIWLQGPEFLRREESDWPSPNTLKKVKEPIEEIRSDFILKISVERNTTYQYLEKFSTWRRVKRVLAWVMRFINNSKSGCKLKGELTVHELRHAENVIFKYVQRMRFSEEVASLKLGNAIDKQSSLYKLNAGLDKQDVLRIFGRLDLACLLPESQRRPIILPPDNKFVELIVAEYHENYLHQNEHTIMCELRRKFYIPRLRSIVKAVKRDCITCRIRNAAPRTPQMGQLPIDRVTSFIRPFTYTGLDYFGPMQVTVARHREKRWIALFTCLTTRAVHLEIAKDLSSGACLMCISNFINRRGVPQRIRSDRGTNFVKAAKDINNDVQAALANKNIEWLFNCPANPSAGGCWERLVQAVKRVLSYTLRNDAPRMEVLQHVLTEAENMVNSRPLTDVIMDSSEADPLTPNDFLLGAPSSVQTSEPVHEITIDLGKQYRVAEQLKAKLWKRWTTEYLPTLIRREKWHEKVNPLKEGQVVVICDENVNRRKWQKGIIVKVNLGKDGQTRSAEVKTVHGIISRPTSKIAVLDIKNGEPCERFTGGGMSANVCDRSADGGMASTP